MSSSYIPGTSLPNQCLYLVNVSQGSLTLYNFQSRSSFTVMDLVELQNTCKKKLKRKIFVFVFIFVFVYLCIFTLTVNKQEFGLWESGKAEMRRLQPGQCPPLPRCCHVKLFNLNTTLGTIMINDHLSLLGFRRPFGRQKPSWLLDRREMTSLGDDHFYFFIFYLIFLIKFFFSEKK